MILALRHMLCLLTLLLPASAPAFDLTELHAQLGAASVVRGDFVQEKHLRGLPQPLVSRGEFVLSAGQGLLWKLHSPLAHTLRITPQGIARYLPDGRWQPAPAGSGRENRLFLALLSGDTQGLAENFELRLEGSAQAWHLRMTPGTVLLRQIFTHIDLHGSALIEQIELHETQGDRTVLRMENTRTGQSLQNDEQRAFTD